MRTPLFTHLERWSNSLASISPTPGLDAEVIVKQVSGLSDAQIITHADQPLSDSIITTVDRLIIQRQQGKPIAYIVGRREFYSLDLKINEHVLIPRPETELLVDAALDEIARTGAHNILDLGTGSGAIALAIAQHAPKTSVIALDNDSNALQLARKNKRSLGLANVRFVLSDWYAALKQDQHKFDLILANPPYIAPDDAHLSRGDVRFEPNQALVSPEGGLADLKHIILNASKYLKNTGGLIVEHGFDQGADVRKLFSDAGFSGISTMKDLAGNDRIGYGQLMPQSK